MRLEICVSSNDVEEAKIIKLLLESIYADYDGMIDLCIDALQGDNNARDTCLLEINACEE